jgi:hypothetical protein
MLDSRYVISRDLEPLLVDKDSGAPLAGGSVYFYQDLARTTLMPIFQLTGAPPNYTYTQLPNPIILSSIGTIQDNNGNNVALYYFPWSSTASNAVLQLYYVVVQNSLGVEQFTRQAWPNYFGEQGGGGGASGVYLPNLIANPQFAFVSFTPGVPLTISSAGSGTFVIPIAPEWSLSVTFSAAGSLTVSQTPVAGSSQFPTNPPYTLDITPISNVTAVSLTQKLNNTPDIWSPATGAANGYIATNITLGNNTTVTISYAPSQVTAGNPQTLLTTTNISGSYKQFSNTVQLLPAANTDTGATGFVNIVIALSSVNPSSITSVQVVGIETNIINVPYQQVPLRFQQADLIDINYANLAYKPIPSYLVGWDFALNPAQFLGPTLAASAAGANTSRYVWDQTIVFQSANSGPAVSRGTNGCLTITATNTTQFALVQYLEQSVARMILNDRNSVNIAAFTNQVGGLQTTVSLWYTTDASLPSCASNNSIVATLNADGSIATAHGNWTQVPRIPSQNATFTIGATPNTTNFNNYGFSGWDLQGIAASNTATFFAIVVGTASLTAANVVNIDSISLVPGNIPTRPAPDTGGLAISKCERYFEMSFNIGLVPTAGLGLGYGMVGYPLSVASAVHVVAPSLVFRVAKNGIPSITFYNPMNNNAQFYDTTTGTDCSLSQVASYNINTNGFLPQTINPGGGAAGDSIVYQFTADARLGV